MIKVKIKKLNELAKIPKYSKQSDAGLDLTATSYNYENDRHVYGTGLAFEIPEGYVGLIFPRSSICKYDMRLTNCVGVVDAGYRGEVKAVFENDMMAEREIYGYEICGVKDAVQITRKKIYQIGERIAQLIILPYPQVEFEEVQDLSDTERSTGGFGSSGV